MASIESLGVHELDESKGITSDEEEMWLKNIFADEWEESDTVLVVEDARFHVHRAILSLFSPVFQVMFSSDFREKEQREVSLPGKEATKFLSFLRLIYSREDYNEVTMENVDALLALGDEYQVARVTKECRKFLMSSSFDLQTAMKFLLLAQKYGFPDLRQKCYKILRSADLESLRGLKGLDEFDQDSVKKVLLPRLAKAEEVVKSLKVCLQEVLQQLVGLLEFTVYFLVNKKRYQGLHFEICRHHYDAEGKAKTGIYKRAKGCHNCKAMFDQIARSGFSRTTYRGNQYHYGYDMHFDEDIFEVVLKVTNVLRKLS